ncbi:cell division protein FtsL [Granulicatella elegans]|uniref:Cell division protein FtsL n=1 Tax=Granulicatella elegans ATCC 700633 TaxID=626369 RepID=D0BLC4_9LACT|nr:cell division protein FtsL [Granulicatella elegans]EEW93877.1 cell division protein FtsL [Granulicatella elegans ATCC 700633]
MALAEQIVDVNSTTTVKEAFPNTYSDKVVTAIPQEKVKVNYTRNMIISIVVIVLLGTLTVVSSMLVANKNRQLQDIQTNTTLMQRKNDTLLQSAQELSQYDRVNRIAKEQGLQMGQNNVRNVGQ